jgi:hypothetical protein
MDEVPRFDSLLREALDPKLLWREIENNLAAFTTKVTFKGGFTIDPITSIGSSESHFLPQGITVFSKTVREIRNALSHGRDQKTSTVIAPTTSNFGRLQPWVSLMAVAAGEVILYYDVL